MNKKKILVVYFSHSGNTEKIAKAISKEIEGDIMKIIPKKPYPSDYNACVLQAKKEESKKTRPDIMDNTKALADYDTIYLGYPCWWGTAPMPVFTYLEQHDFTEKVIYPFTTHGGSGFARSISDIKESAHGADVKDGFSIHDNHINTCLDELRIWLTKH